MVPGRGSPAPTPAARSHTAGGPLCPSPPLPPRPRCPRSHTNPGPRGAANGDALPVWFGEPPLLFILFLLCPGVSMFDSVLVSIRSGSRSLLRNDFWCCLSLDRVSVRISRDLFQLVLPSCISAVEPIHPPGVTTAVPPRSPVPRGARPKPAVQSFGTIAAVSASFTSTKRPKLKGLWPRPHRPSGLEWIPNAPALLVYT